MQDSRVLITGGAGLIGSHIADQLARERVAAIVALDSFSRGRRANLAWVVEHAPVTIVEGDVRDRKLLAELMKDIDIVFHQAAIRIPQCAEEPRLGFEVLVDGTFNVLEAAASAGVRKVIAVSSASVYGSADAFPTQENHHPYNNRTLYGAAKTFNEGLLRSFHQTHGLDYVALRYFNVYGPRMDTEGLYAEVLVRWIEQLAVGKPPIIFGDGSQTMDLVHVSDVARANILAARATLTDEVLNIGSGQETSLEKLAGLLAEIMGSPLHPVHAPERSVSSVPRRLADVSKAKELLGFEARVSLAEGLGDLVAWWQRERTACPA